MLLPHSTLLIAAFLLPLIGMSCTESKAVGQSHAEESTTVAHKEGLSLSARAARYKRPYGDRAPWNLPVRGFRQHAKSKKYSDLLWQTAAMRPGNFNIGTDSYTYAVYSVTEAVGLYPVSTEWQSNIDGTSMP